MNELEGVALTVAGNGRCGWGKALFCDVISRITLLFTTLRRRAFRKP